MRKQLKYIIIAVIICVLLIAALLLLLYLPDKDGNTTSESESSVAEIKILDKTIDDLKSISVKNEMDSYVCTVNGKDDIEIDKLVDYPVSDLTLSTLASNAASISADKIISENTESLSEYGFDSPTASVSVSFKDNTEFKFEIGDKSPGDTGYYFKEQNKNTVYLVSVYSLSSFTDPLKEFIDLSITDTIENEDMTNIDNIILGGTQREEFVFKKLTEEEIEKGTGFDAYKMTKPIDMSADSQTLSDIMQSFSSIYASDVVSLDVSNDILKKYGLDKPKNTLAFDLNGKTTKILFGNKDSDGIYYYIMKPGGKVIYTVSVGTFKFFDYNLRDFASKLQFIVNIDKVKAITVSWNGKEYKFDLEGEGEDLTVKSAGKIINTDNFRNLYQLFIGSSIEGEVQKPKTQPSLTYKFEYKDGSKADTIKFKSVDGQKFFIEINDKGHFYILKNYIDKVTASVEKIINGKEISVDY